jgi:hypothetical protein
MPFAFGPRRSTNAPARVDALLDRIAMAPLDVGQR